MNINCAKYAAAIGCASFLAVSTRANTIYELGKVVPSEPADTTSETLMLTDLIKSYNTGSPASPFTIIIGPHTDVGTLHPGSFVPAAPLPAPGLNAGQFGGSGGNVTTTLALGAGGFDYAMVKWGNSSEFYYIHGLTGNLTVGNDVNENGESHYDLWDAGPKVPDGGTTVLLLGCAISGLGLLRRKLS